MQASRAAETNQAAGLRPWHNPLPGWILDDPKFATLKSSGRLLLQTIADSCDPPAREHELGPGTLKGAFGTLKSLAQRIGASDRNTGNTARLLNRLIDLGFLVRTACGGRLRVAEKRGTLLVASAYTIPGVERRGDGCVTTAPKCAVPPAKMCGPPRQNSAPPMVKDYVGKNTIGVSTKRTAGKGKWFPVHPELLKNPEGIGELYAQAVLQGLVGRSEEDAVGVFACAAHSRRVATKNPCGLFATMIRNRGQMWLFATNADQELGGRWYREWREAGGEIS